MTALTAYQRIVVQGLGPGSEIWQTGVTTVALSPLVDQPALQSYCNTLEPMFNTWWNSCKVSAYPLYKYTGINAYQYQWPNTKAQFQAQTLRAAVAGTGAAGGCPIDTACVVSIRSAVPGRSARGRMYVPFHKAMDALTGLIIPADAAVIGTATKALFAAIVGGSTGAPIVASRTHGTWYPPTSLVTDNKPDVQRRRENRLAPGTIQVLPFP